MTSAVFLKIEDFATLRAGWCYGEGVGFSQESIAAALKVARSLLAHGFGQLDAFPGINGEIRVTAYVGACYFEFTIEPDLAVTFVREWHEKEVDYRSGLSLPDCLSRIPDLGHDLCNWFASSIRGISTGSVDGSKAWRSGPQATVEYRSFAGSAPSTSAGGFACTSARFTRASAGNRRFSGPSTRTYFLPAMNSASRSATPRILAIGTS